MLTKVPVWGALWLSQVRKLLDAKKQTNKKVKRVYLKYFSFLFFVVSGCLSNTE